MLAQIRRSFEEHPASEDEDLLAFWSKGDGAALVDVHALVQFVHSMPASSASAERLFSSLNFLNDQGQNTKIDTLANLATIREHALLPDYKLCDLLSAVTEFSEEKH